MDPDATRWGRNGVETPAPRSGMTVLELMIVVSIIGILAILAMPFWLRSISRTQDAHFLNDLRMLCDNTFERYAIDHGDYPADAPAGVPPAGVSSYLPRRLDWDKPTPIGGKWDWDRAEDRKDEALGYYAGIAVDRPRRTAAQMRAIDRLIDDGDTSGGRFRRRGSGYVWVTQD